MSSASNITPTSADCIFLNTLKIVTLNVHGFRQGVAVLTSFCNKNEFNIDIICLQELWLTPDTFYQIESFSEDYVCYGMSAMDKAVRSSVLKGRPYGGVCLLLKRIWLI